MNADLDYFPIISQPILVYTLSMTFYLHFLNKCRNIVVVNFMANFPSQIYVLIFIFNFPYYLSTFSDTVYSIVIV